MLGEDLPGAVMKGCFGDMETVFICINTSSEVIIFTNCASENTEKGLEVCVPSIVRS